MLKFESLPPWFLLESLFSESKQYRGDNSVRLKDLEKMLDSIIEKGRLQDPNTSIDRDGGAFSCQYSFDPQIWGKWFPSQDLALSMASMDKDVVSQYAGRAQGHMVHKMNWGGRVVGTPGKPRGDFERMPSAMDRYDVLMHGDITTRTKVNRKTGKSEEVPMGNLLRVAYSPSVGSTEERKARLLAFMAGHSPPPLKRRVQPDVPDIDRAAAQDASANQSPSVPRVGQNLKTAPDDDQRAPGGLKQRDRNRPDFSQFLSKHNAEYRPQVKRDRDQDDEADDALNSLFPRKK